MGMAYPSPGPSTALAGFNSPTRPPGRWRWVEDAPRPVTKTPPKLRVRRVEDENPFEETWFWTVWHYEDRAGQRSHVSPRWGRASRFEDALAGGLAALHHENQEREKES